MEVSCTRAESLTAGPPEVALAHPDVVAAYLGGTAELPAVIPPMPEGLVLPRTAGPFEAETVPAGLRTWHRVADATWGCLCVLEGSLTNTFDLPPPFDVQLEEGARQPISPGVRHLVRLDGPVRFTVEFFAEAPTS